MTSAHPLLEDYRESFFREFADRNDLQIEWMMPSKLPAESGEKLHRTQNPEGITQGPPRGRHGMTLSNS